MRVIGWAFVLVVPHCIDNQIEAALQQQQLDRHIKNPGGSGVSKIEAVLQQQLDRVIENEGGGGKIISREYSYSQRVQWLTIELQRMQIKEKITYLAT